MVSGLSQWFRYVLVAILALPPVIGLAQKSSRALDPVRSESLPIENANTTRFTVVDDSVTQNVRNVKNEVRILLRPVKESRIAAGMSGIIEAINFQVGERFNKGDLLIKMQCDTQTAKLSSIYSRIQRYKTEYSSNQELYKSRAVSKYTLDISKANLDEQYGALKEVKAIIELCEIRAPFDGGVVSLNVNAYESTDASAQLMTIIDDSELVMSLNIPSIFISKVTNGKYFYVTVDETGGTYKAEVTGVSPAIDSVSKTIELRAKIIEGVEHLRPGMSGRAILEFSDS